MTPVIRNKYATQTFAKDGGEAQLNEFNNNETGNLLPCLEVTKQMWRSADAVCFDVDSTVIRNEGIDQLAVYCKKEDLVKNVTQEAMRGGMEFRDALRMRLNLIQPSMDILRDFIKHHPPELTDDIDALVDVLHNRGTDVYLISGGFDCLIAPVAKQLNIPLENVFTNRIKFFFDGSYAGFDESQPTSRSGGKGKAIQVIKERNGYTRVVMIGDGATDMEACPPADAFIGFGGNAVRSSVKNAAPWYIYDFKTLIKELGKEQS